MKNKFLTTIFLIGALCLTPCSAFGNSLSNDNLDASQNESSTSTSDTDTKTKTVSDPAPKPLTTAMPSDAQQPDLQAAAAILIDAKTGEILYEKNSQEKQFPASITKLMTVLLVFESGKTDDTITFSYDAVHGIEYGSSNIGIDEGEQLTMEQALYAMMLQSANEVCLGVAEHISGTVATFCKQMTARAKELGAVNTNFVNPNGLHDENHYTTAYDMALIARELLKYDKFKEVIRTVKYDIPPTNITDETRHLYAQNQMIKPPSIYVYDGCEGGKTGFTSEAQQTLVSYAKREDTELISVVLKAQGAGHYEDTIKLFDYGFDNYKTAELLPVSSFTKEIPVTETQDKKETQEIGKVTIAPANDVYKTVLKDMDTSKITQNVVLDDTLPAPIHKGDIVGSIALSYDGTLLDTVNLTAQNSVETTKSATKTDGSSGKLLHSIQDFFTGKGILLTVIKVIAALMLTFAIVLTVTRSIGAYQRKKRREARRRRNIEYRRRSRETQQE